MEIIKKENIESFKLPLPIYSAIHIAEAESRDKEKFSIFIGLDENMIAELKALSLDENDTEIQKNTSDRKRFGEGSYEDWYKKNRTPFVLIHKSTATLAGLVWLGPEPLKSQEGNWHTIAWRSYPNFRGKGLMKGFTKFAINIYIEQIPDAKISAVIKKDNSGSAGFAEALGFKELPEASNGNNLVMVKY